MWPKNAQYYNERKSMDTCQLCLTIVSIRKVHLTHTDGTDIRPQTAQFHN